MQLYKGEVKGDGTVNWKDPQPLAENPQLKALNLGKSLFINNCAACHSIDNKIVTGPSLAHMVKRSDWMIHYNDKSAFYHHDSIMVSTSPEHNLLYAYTRNNQKVLGMGLDYFTCLYNKYNKVQMPAYPNLTDEDLDNLYGYIENESMLRDLPIPDNGILKCSDSCRIYRETKTRLQEIKARLEKDSTDMRGIYYSAPNSPRTTIPPESGGLPIKVSPPQNRSLYYQFTIDVFGWYNVDMFLQQNTSTSESRLEVRVQGQYHERFNIYLVIPQVKLFGEGGQLEDKKDVYGFYTQDGKLPLPQNATAYILAMGEYEDQIIFAKKEFTTSKDQQLTIELQTISKETYRQEIGALSFSGLGISVADTKVAEELRKTIRNLKKAEELEPKTCDCNCFLRQEADSVLEEGPIITYPAK
jgi:hypothetical protein